MNYNIYDSPIGLNKWLRKDIVLTNYEENQLLTTPTSSGFSVSYLTSGEQTALITVVKKSFTDTTEGKCEGFDTDNEYKWIIGNDTNSIDWNVTTDNTLTVIGTISGSVIIGGELHIPDQDTTANSFHVETDGDTWWGCTETNWTADHNNANAYVLSTGVAQFQAVTITGGSSSVTGDALVGGWTATSSGTLANSTNIILDASNKAISINDATYGNSGIQLQYNGGTPRLYAGNGSTEYFQYDGANISWASPTSSLDTAGKLTTTSADIGGWNVINGYIYNLVSGTPTSSPNDGIVLASGNEGIIVYEDTAKRIELGYLSSGVYGLKGYATNGSDVVFEVSDTQQKIAGWYFDTTSLADNATAANAKIYIDSANTLIRAGATTGDYLTIDGNNLRIRSSNYVSGVFGAGFTLEPDLLEVGNIAARGIIRTAVFQKDVVHTIGGNFAVLDSDVLNADMDATDAETLTIEGNTTFVNNDILRIKDGIDDEWMTITDASGAPTYVVTRDNAGSYAPNTNPTWKKGATVVNYGQSGDGGVYMTASETNAPYLSIFDHTGSPWTTINTRVRLGNLNGFLGYSSDLYGIAIGETNKYLKYDITNGLRVKGQLEVIAGSTLPTLPNDDSLIGYWNLDEGVGTISIDSTRYINNGTLYNTPTWSNGVSGSCLTFNGTDQYIGIPNEIIANSMSIVIWIKIDSSASGNNVIISSLENTVLSNYDGYSFGYNATSGLLLFSLYANSSSVLVSLSSAITKNVWHQIAITTESGSSIMYIDGVAVDTDTTSYTYFDTTLIPDTDIGRYNFTNNLYFKGLIDEVRVYNRILNDLEVYSLYQNPSGVSQQGVKQLGGSYATASSGALMKFDNTQFYIQDDGSNQVIKATLTGINIGDFEIGDYSGANEGILWDKSAADLLIKGSITITGGSGIASLSDAGNLATADDLDDVSDGSTYAKVLLTDISAGHIVLVGSTASININDTTFGNQGIQLQYNTGTPRAYIGDGSTKYFKFDGTDVILGADTTIVSTNATLIQNRSNYNFTDWFFTGSFNDGFTETVSGTLTRYGLFTIISSNSGACSLVSFDLGSYGSLVTFSTDIEMNFVVKTANSNDNMFWGLCDNGQAPATSDNNRAVGFLVDNSGKLYAKTSDASGVGNSEQNEITGITLTTKHYYKIVFDAGTAAYFYIDDVLKATNTTYLPSHGGASDPRMFWVADKDVSDATFYLNNNYNIKVNF